jgi:hypothetical protein
MHAKPTTREVAGRGREDERRERNLALRLGRFAWMAIDEQSATWGVSPEDLVTFAVLYYLADVDSGRVARQIPRGDTEAPEGDISADGPRPLRAAASARQAH